MTRTLLKTFAGTAMLLLAASGPAFCGGDGDIDGRDFLVWQRGGTHSPNGNLTGTQKQSKALTLKKVYVTSYSVGASSDQTNAGAGGYRNQFQAIPSNVGANRHFGMRPSFRR